jgi:hypothetical protein
MHQNLITFIIVFLLKNSSKINSACYQAYNFYFIFKFCDQTKRYPSNQTQNTILLNLDMLCLYSLFIIFL